MPNQPLTRSAFCKYRACIVFCIIWRKKLNELLEYGLTRVQIDKLRKRTEKEALARNNENTPHGFIVPIYRKDSIQGLKRIGFTNVAYEKMKYSHPSCTFILC
jgi:hypothetical protein